MEATARALWGEPNPRLSSATELRWGAQGSRSVDLQKGVWHDHEAGQGGGVLDLVRQEKRVTNGEAVDFLRREIGADIPDDRRPAQAQPQRCEVASYDYRDESGELLFQVVRFEPKDFRQRQPTPDGRGWNWSVKGVRQVPYRLPELLEAVALEHTVYIVEGEKDADALWRAGVPATCNAGGAGKWPDGLAEAFQGADVVILPDNDDAGQNHASVVGAALQGVASKVRLLALPDLPPKGDVSDWIGLGYVSSDLHELVRTKAKVFGVTEPKSRFGAVTWGCIDHVVARRDWLVEDMTFAGDMMLIYGASQSGKSFLAVDMGLAIARGTDFLGKKTRKGAVVYQAGEGGLGLISRLKAYRQHHSVYGQDDLPFVLLPAKADLFNRDGDADALIEEVLGWKAALSEPLGAVFIDTFATASPGANENTSEDMSRVLATGHRIQETAKCAVIWVHHKNAGGEKPRGHTSIYANADSALEVIRDPDEPQNRTIRIAKVKDGEDGEKLGFRLQPVEIGTYDSGKPITSCVVVPAEVGPPRTGKSLRLPSGPLKFLKLLDDAIDQYGGALPVIERIPHNMRGVEWAAFRDLYVTAAGHGLADDAIRQALKRDGDKLFNMGLINKHDHWCWITDKGRAML